MRSFLLASTLLLTGCGCRQDGPTQAVAIPPVASTSAPNPPRDARDVGAWSPVVEGVRGRLVATALVDANGKPQLAVDLDLENVSDMGNPIEIYCGGDGQALVHFAAEDESGTALAQPSHMGGSYASPPPFWLELLHGSSLHVTITKAAYEYVSPTDVLLRPKTFEAWPLPAQRTTKLYLRAKVVAFPSPPDARDHRAWKGPLDLPRVALP
jgi:hypothetical protein